MLQMVKSEKWIFYGIIICIHQIFFNSMEK